MCCHNLAASFRSLSRYPKANECNQEALFIASKIGDRDGKANSLLVHGHILYSISNCVKTKECYEEAIAISKEIGDRDLQANCCLSLGKVLFKDGEYVKAE